MVFVASAPAIATMLQTELHKGAQHMNEILRTEPSELMAKAVKMC